MQMSDADDQERGNSKEPTTGAPVTPSRYIRKLLIYTESARCALTLLARARARQPDSRPSSDRDIEEDRVDWCSLMELNPRGVQYACFLR